MAVQVIKIERVQHAKLWRRYAIRRAEVEEERGKAGEPALAIYRVPLHKVYANIAGRIASAWLLVGALSGS